MYRLRDSCFLFVGLTGEASSLVKVFIIRGKCNISINSLIAVESFILLYSIFRSPLASEVDNLPGFHTQLYKQ